MVLNKLYFLLGIEVVYATGFEVVEGVISGGKDSHAFGGAVDLAIYLVSNLG